MKKKWSLFLSTLLAVSIALSACGSDKAKEPEKNAQSNEQGSGQEEKKDDAAGEGEIVSEGVIKAADPSKSPELANNRKDMVILGITAPKGIFNPIYSETSYDAYLVRSLFKGMLEYDKDGTLKKALADDYQVSPDNLKYTFKLKEGLKFSDGTPLTAEDVAFTLTILHDKSYDGPSDIVKNAHIKGGQEYRDGKVSSIEGIKVIDPLTIEFTTTEVSALALSTIGGVEIMPKAYYGKDYKQGDLGYMHDLFTKPVGAGPYKLDKFVAGQEAQLTANENYYLGKPKVEKLIYKFTTAETNVQLLQTGETDMDEPTVSKDQVEQLKEMGFLDTTLYRTNGYGYIAFNHKLDKFKDKRVRQALAYGLNRQEIVDAVFQGYADPIDVPQSKQSWSYTDDVTKYNFDLEKAKQLLDEAGWKVGADGKREKNGEKFVIHFTASTPSEVNDAIIPIAQKNYGDLGIEFIADQMEFNAVIDKRKKGDFDMLFMAWSLTPDPQSSENVFTTKGHQNDIGYSNPKVDELFIQSNSTLDVEKRKEIFHSIYKELNEDLPYIYMYQRRDMYATNARVQGFDMSPYRDFSYSLPNIQIQ
ncbi:MULTISPECIES: ABC transporter substrate-binding protein [Paenibacillus]|uniref:ABC transporter substrate-binding protein n=1 Tax=Paenibacillus alvei TaxID=44250 RepID=A0ABT4E856_PAEAL|nr:MULTISPECIES: ABC transporter substrate-binding protein [Paenibacillus]EPY13128.1 peptide ABC transporter periplasmic protein [Paenibacillus alvei A6-6i-x]MCY9529912.1 ABC transporter substrate-binding protein [Paenibacillus alvei]SDE78016.1 peptide/nickel transport system substrate-binding protein [Paenibacillus sp. cl6col]